MARTRMSVKEKDRKKLRTSIIVLIVVVVLAAFFLLINFITDWMWFGELGYTSVFFTELLTKLKFGVPAFVILTLLMWLYLTTLRRGYFRKIVSSEATNTRRLGIYTFMISAVFGLVVAVYFVNRLWFQLLQFSKATDFGIRDPIFGLDISFYVFRYEFLDIADAILIFVIVLFFIATLIYYGILLTMRTPDVLERDEAEPIEDGKFSAGTDDAAGQETESSAAYGDSPFGKFFSQFMNAGAARQRPQYKPKKKVSHTNMRALLDIASGKLIILAVVFFLMVGLNFLLKQFDLLHSHTGAVYGAGFTDVNITLWVYRLLILLSAAGAVVTAVLIKKRKKLIRLIYVPALMIAVSILGGVISMVVQSIVVSPDEINKESKYLAYNIKYTQSAYGVDDVDVRGFAAENGLTAEDIAANDETINNIRINDYQPVETFYNQTQSIRQYYRFNDVDVDRYVLDDDYTQTFLAVREIDEEKINDTWINRHLKYTHGYGAAVSKVDTITASGQPEVIAGDIPPVSDVREIQMDRPEIYFGELSNDYVIVNSDEEEFDYPDGEANKYTSYEGDAGIKLGFLNRIMFSIREGSMNLLVSKNVNSDSRILINRNIVKRVERIMPYLTYEDDPYAVVIDGRIYWIIDAFTTSPYYPYSEPYSGTVGSTNYVRNSVKVVVDAYNGNVDYYIVDPEDPIALTYQKIFPRLFKDMSDMPEELKAHLRYPGEIFQIQADVYARYHMNDVKVFYQNEDIWEVSHEIYGREEVKMSPNYYVLNLPGEAKAEFVSALPYSPRSKQNMTALIMTRNDGEHYGELVLYQFPKNISIYGPLQIEAQIDQNTRISQDFSLWSQAGSTYSRGNLFVIPIEQSLMYVEPIYLEASNSAIPEVKRVVVAYQDRIAYAETLQEALTDMFGDIEGGAGPGGQGGAEQPPVAEGTQDEYIRAAQKAYADAQEAVSRGDWAAYGRHMEELKDALDHLTAGEQAAPGTGTGADQGTGAGSGTGTGAGSGTGTGADQGTGTDTGAGSGAQ